LIIGALVLLSYVWNQIFLLFDNSRKS